MPTVTINPAQKGGTWILTAIVNANSNVTTAFFEYGITVGLGLVMPTINVGSGGAAVGVSQELPVLQDNTTYYFRITATNSGGTAVSSILSFSTATNPGFFVPNISVISSANSLIQVQNVLQYGVSTTLSRDSVNNTVCFVENSAYLTTSQKYLLGTIGASNAEIVQISSIAAPTTATPSQVTFVNAPVNRHGRGEPLTLVTFDQVEISTCATVDGYYAVIATTNLQLNALNTIYQDGVARNTNFYRARFYNTQTTNFSNYSLPVSSAVGTVDNTAGYLISSVKRTLGIDGKDPRLTNQFFIDALNEGRQIVENELAMSSGKMREWRAVFEYPIKMLAGTNYVTLPTNIDYTHTNRALLNARYSNNSVGSALPLYYIDKSQWNFSTYQRRYSTVAIPAVTSATTIILANTGDFPAQGSITLQAEDFTQSPIVVSYTNNNVNTNTLTGCTGVTRNISVGSQAWAYQTQMYPINYTVFDGKLYFDSVVSAQMQGKNVFIDYYSVYTDVTTMQDVLPEHYRNIYKNYLRFAIKRRRDNTIGEDDPDYVRFYKAATSVFSNEYLGQTIRIT